MKPALHPELSGPDFLDKVADAEEANGNYVNASEYRRRAKQWRELQQQLDAREADVIHLSDEVRALKLRLAMRADGKQPKPSVVVYAAQGFGKSLNARHLMRAFGASVLIEPWSEGIALPRTGCLALTTRKPANVPSGVLVMPLSEALTFAEVAA